MSWKRNYFASGGGSGGVQGLMTPRNMTSIAPSKGLSNEPGQNSCFLNSALQVRYGDTHTKYLLLTHSESHLYDTLTLTPQSLSFTHTHTHTHVPCTHIDTQTSTHTHTCSFISELWGVYMQRKHIFIFPLAGLIFDHLSTHHLWPSLCAFVWERLCVCVRERDTLFVCESERLGCESVCVH